jgi:hypothetical protein
VKRSAREASQLRGRRWVCKISTGIKLSYTRPL